VQINSAESKKLTFIRDQEVLINRDLINNASFAFNFRLLAIISHGYAKKILYTRVVSAAARN